MSLSQKNVFVLALHAHLQAEYQTDASHIYGAGEFEAARVGKAGYALVRKDPGAPEDLNGFCFRKDLCAHTPSTPTEILREIHRFASQEAGIESKFELGSASMELQFDKRRYMITPYIGRGYADSIEVSFIELPRIAV